MEIINLALEDTLLNRFVAEIRDVAIQGDRLRFRRNLERIGEVMAYEISRQLTYGIRQVETPLGIAPTSVSQDSVVIATILRAGLPFHQGFLSYMDDAENAFVSAYRKYSDESHFDIHIEYIASPRLENKVLLLTDPMLATGSSMELAYRALLSKGKPSHLHIAAVIASQQAVEYLKTHLADVEIPITLWVAAIDPTIDAHSYIIPGLGDAGDLAYGSKE